MDEFSVIERLRSGVSTECRDGPDEPCFTHTVPRDLDMEKFKRGREFFKSHVTQCLVAMFMSLVCGLSVPNLLEALWATGVTDSPDKSIRRYLHTAEHVMKWHYGDVWADGSDARESLRNVRKIHHAVRKGLNAKFKRGLNVEFDFDNIVSDDLDEGGRSSNGEGNALLNDRLAEAATGDCSTSCGTSKIYLSQYDMSLVQCGFMGVIIMHPETVGVRCSEEELDDYVYFWRWIGHLLGIRDENNICIGGYASARRACQAIEKEILFPSITSRPKHFYELAKAATDGMNMKFHTRMFSPECYFIVAFQEAGRRYPFPVPFADKVRVKLFHFIVGCHRYVPGFTWFVNKVTEKWFGANSIT